MKKIKDLYKIWITNPRGQNDSYKKGKKKLRKEGGGNGGGAATSGSFGGGGGTVFTSTIKMIKDLFSFVVKALKKDEKKFQAGKTFRQQASSMSMNDNIARVDYKKAWMGGYQADALATAGDKDEKQYVIDEIEEETEDREFH